VKPSPRRAQGNDLWSMTFGDNGPLNKQIAYEIGVSESSSAVDSSFAVFGATIIERQIDSPMPMRSGLVVQNASESRSALSGFSPGLYRPLSLAI